MSTSPNAVSPLRRRMIEDMTVRRFTEKTQGDYIRHVRAFAAFLGRSTELAELEDLRRLQRHGSRRSKRMDVAVLIVTQGRLHPPEIGSTTYHKRAGLSITGIAILVQRVRIRSTALRSRQTTAYTAVVGTAPHTNAAASSWNTSPGFPGFGRKSLRWMRSQAAVRRSQ